MIDAYIWEAVWWEQMSLHWRAMSGKRIKNRLSVNSDCLWTQLFHVLCLKHKSCHEELLAPACGVLHAPPQPPLTSDLCSPPPPTLTHHRPLPLLMARCGQQQRDWCPVNRRLTDRYQRGHRGLIYLSVPQHPSPSTTTTATTSLSLFL